MSSPNDSGNPPPVNPQAEEVRRLALRRREQLYYARHMQRSRQRLQETGQALTTAREQVDRRVQEFQRDRTSWDAEKARAQQRFAEQAKQIAQQVQELEAARASFRPQLEQLERARAELQQARSKLQQEAQGANQADIERRVAAQVRNQVEAEFQATSAKKEEEYDQALFELQRRQRQAILEMENSLAKKQEELDRVTTELKQRPETAVAPAAEDRAAHKEAERLQKLLAARNRELAEVAVEQERDAAAFEKQRQEMQATIDNLNQLMAEQTQALRKEQNRQREDDKGKPPAPAVAQQLAEKDAEIERLKAETGALRRMLAGREQKPVIPPEEDALSPSSLSDAPRILTPPPVRKQAVEVPVAVFDIAGYEAELTEFRRQLEADRRDLEEQVQQMRQRQSDLDEAGGRAEVEICRERASLSRERAQLERMRAEVRSDMERMQREGGLREALMGVQKLAEERNDRRPPSEPAPHKDGNARGVGGLLRSLRSKFRDG
jgi:chromosome segregation ATPase